MKYVVKNTGLSVGRKQYAKGEGFPANVKGFDYDKAISRGLIEENKDGVVSRRKPKEAVSPGLQGPSADRDVDEGNGERG